MRRLITSLAIAGMFALGASPVLADSAGFASIDLAGGVLDCGVHSYTFTSGTFEIVYHSETTPSGNFQNSATLTARDVVAVDAAGNDYSIQGIFHFGGTNVATTNNGPFHFEAKLQVVSRGGGAVDSVNVVLVVTPRAGYEFDFGTCVPLG